MKLSAASVIILAIESFFLYALSDSISIVDNNNHPEPELLKVDLVADKRNSTVVKSTFADAVIRKIQARNDKPLKRVRRSTEKDENLNKGDIYGFGETSTNDIIRNIKNYFENQRGCSKTTRSWVWGPTQCGPFDVTGFCIDDFEYGDVSTSDGGNICSFHGYDAKKAISDPKIYYKPKIRPEDRREVVIAEDEFHNCNRHTVTHDFKLSYRVGYKTEFTYGNEFSIEGKAEFEIAIPMFVKSTGSITTGYKHIRTHTKSENKLVTFSSSVKVKVPPGAGVRVYIIGEEITGTIKYKQRVTATGLMGIYFKEKAWHVQPRKADGSRVKPWKGWYHVYGLPTGDLLNNGHGYVYSKLHLTQSFKTSSKIGDFYYNHNVC